jgi:hypothetical protein
MGTTGAPAKNSPPRLPAEELPPLYRAVLDLAIDLERLGDAREAARIRSQAIGAYSAVWDRRSLDSLTRLRLKAMGSVEARRARVPAPATPDPDEAR